VEGLVSLGDWTGRRVLVTGHTGFKGAWLALWLERLGARVEGLALAPATTPSLHALLGKAVDPVDLRHADTVSERVRDADPEIIFHLAARSLVRPAFADPVGTYEVNVVGTANLLEAVRALSGVRAVVVVTSDKVYAPEADDRPYTEDSPLGGVEPYSTSKASAELVASAYRHGYFASTGVGLATARAGNVIGGGDWAVDRIVPDVLRALERSEPVVLRRPEAVRPWQHVLDSLYGYLLLAERLLERPADAPPALNFGPDPAESCSVAELVERMTDAFGGKPGWQRDEKISDAPETATLKLDASRAKAELGWSPALGLADAIAWTVAWHAAHANGEDVRAVTTRQLADYEQRL
jgi:CDP-glucose 4,6-dehydratase